MQKNSYGTTRDHQPVVEYTLTNGDQLEVKVINYGGIITSIKTPDRKGVMQDIVLGLENLQDYETKNAYFGCAVGRFGNRIAGGKFSLDGKSYQVAVNDGANHLHGGLKGFDKQVWEVRQEIDGPEGEGVALFYRSPNGEENYPGNLEVTITYTVTPDNALRIDYQATTDQATILNLTNHTYWNLAGEGSGSVVEHIVALNADRYTPVNQNLIPTGELAPVSGTPLDFRQPKRIGEDLRSDFPQIAISMGFDHNWVLNRESLQDRAMVQAAEVSEPTSGRRLQVFTTEPGIQFYTGNFLNGTLYGPSHRAYRQGDGLCLETQHFPNSPNQPNFPSTVLRPGEVFQSATIYKLSTDR